VALLKSLSTAQSIGVVSASIFYVVAGTLHFIKPDAYLRIMPPYIPWHAAMVRISGGLLRWGRLPLQLLLGWWLLRCSRPRVAFR
jgi:uncharacterized membrane protein